MGISFTNALTILISCMFLCISLALCAIAIRSAIQDGRRVEERLAGGDGRAIETGIRRKQNLLMQLGSHLTLPDAKNITRIRFQLAQAGYYDHSAVKGFLAARVICLFVPQLLALIFWGWLVTKIELNGTILLTIVLLVTGLLGPDFWLRYKAGKRTDECRRGFPDMMDLMVACIEAGLGLDATLVRVSHELGRRYPTLKVNLDIMNLELRAGRERHEAMMNFATRINLEEAKSLSVMLKQAEEMGSSIGKALRTFSEDMRHKRMMTAEEKAMALSAKLTVPLIVFIFPTIMVMLMLPAGLRIAAGMG